MWETTIPHFCESLKFPIISCFHIRSALWTFLYVCVSHAPLPSGACETQIFNAVNKRSSPFPKPCDCICADVSTVLEIIWFHVLTLHSPTPVCYRWERICWANAPPWFNKGYIVPWVSDSTLAVENITLSFFTINLSSYFCDRATKISVLIQTATEKLPQYWQAGMKCTELHWHIFWHEKC